MQSAVKAQPRVPSTETAPLLSKSWAVDSHALLSALSLSRSLARALYHADRNGGAAFFSSIKASLTAGRGRGPSFLSPRKIKSRAALAQPGNVIGKFFKDSTIDK